MSLAQRLYSLAWWLATPLVAGYLLWRARRQPEYLQHWGERWGRHPVRTDAAPLVWIHAVSVGETRAAAPLVARLREAHPEVRILLTHMTPTGRETARALFGDGIAQAWLPYDYGFAMRRFLRAWRPALGILMETELWPNLARIARAEGMPLALVSARLSEKSLARGERWSALIRPALADLSYVAAQTDADAARIHTLGRSQVDVLGNLKFDVAFEEAMLARGERWRAAIGARPVVLAASTRDGEEALLADAWCEKGTRQLQASGAARARARSKDGPGDAADAGDAGSSTSRPLLVIVPRHPQRFAAVEALLVERGWVVARRSQALPADGLDVDVPIDPATDVLLGDSMGEMPAWYALADSAVIGGTLLPFGGQNLIEACAAGCPVIVGPHTYNFAEAALGAIDAGAAERVRDASEALERALAIARDPARAARMRDAGLAFAEAHRGAAARIVAALGPWLER